MCYSARNSHSSSLSTVCKLLQSSFSSKVISKALLNYTFNICMHFVVYFLCGHIPLLTMHHHGWSSMLASILHPYLLRAVTLKDKDTQTYELHVVCAVAFHWTIVLAKALTSTLSFTSIPPSLSSSSCLWM